MDWEVLGPLLSGLGVGTVVSTTVSTYLTSGQSRRTGRGAVLAALSGVEETRWAGPEENISYSTFQTKCRALETAALIARVPREAVMQYLVYAHAARMNSQDNWDEHQVEEVGGFVDPAVDKNARDAAAALTNVIWRPWLSRLFLGERLRGQRRTAYLEISDPFQYQINKSRKYFGLQPEVFGHSRALPSKRQAPSRPT